MNKRYKYLHKIPFVIIAVILNIILVAGVVVNIIDLVNFAGVQFGILPLFTVIFSSVIIILTFLMIFNTHYSVGEKYFKLTIGFIYNRKEYSDILLLREHPDKKILLMYFKRKIKGEYYIEHMVINIKPSQFADFIDDVRKRNPTVEYELFREYSPIDNE